MKHAISPSADGLGRMFTVIVMVMMMAATMAAADGDQAPVPDKTHKCPVCGMVVYRYPDFIASVTYSDRHSVFFDGVKDMFKYLFNIAKYEPVRKLQDIKAIYVTEYYDMKPIDGRQAFYVLGSEVYGPMGHELIPLQSDADARQFLKDHRGHQVLLFDDITPAVIQRLD